MPERRVPDAAVERLGYQPRQWPGMMDEVHRDKLVRSSKDLQTLSFASDLGFLLVSGSVAILTVLDVFPAKPAIALILVATGAGSVLRYRAYRRALTNYANAENERANRTPSAQLEPLLAERYDLATKGLLRPLTSGEDARLKQLEAALRAHDKTESTGVDYSKADRFDASLDKLEEHLGSLAQQRK